MALTLDQRDIDDAHQRLNLHSDSTWMEFVVPGPGASVVFLHFTLPEYLIEAFLKENPECIDVELDGRWTNSEDIPDGSFGVSNKAIAIRYILVAS
jgi:hypothetical protein